MTVRPSGRALPDVCALPPPPSLRAVKVADIGAVVRSYRKAAGLSQQDLASMAKISRATLNYLESGRDLEIGAGRLLALVDLLGIPLSLPTGVDRKQDERLVEHVIRAGGVKVKTARRVLDEALATGRVPAGTDTTVRAVLDRLTATEGLALVRCVCAATGQPAKVVWRNLRTVAVEVGSDGWTHTETGD